MHVLLGMKVEIHQLPMCLLSCGLLCPPVVGLGTLAARWMRLFPISSNKQSINKVGSVDNKAKLKRPNLHIVYHNSKRYNENDIYCQMVTFWMAFLVNN